MSNNRIFTEKLRSLGLRPTQQRKIICKLLFDRKDTFHFTIDDLNNSNLYIVSICGSNVTHELIKVD